jgi:hypothetical protein
MKYLLLFLLVFARSSWGQLLSASNELTSQRGKLVGRDFVLEQVLIDRVLEESKVEQKKALRQAKFFMINGETEKARASLDELQKTASADFKASIYRFLAIADFQDGLWKRALAHLSRPELTAYPNFSRICPLKIIMRIAVKETAGLDEEWSRCKIENTKDVLIKDMVWMESLVAIASKKRGAGKAILGKYSPVNLSNDDLKVILKLSLYLNLEGTLVESLEALDYSVIQDEELRGLIAHIYFRQGRLADSWRLMEDVQSPNVENMKGNLWILRNNSELAYAQFKLALQEKSNSHNAVERALPLAWFLQQWKEGMKLADRIYTHERNGKQKSTTIAAFAVANEQWKEAFERLESVHQQGGDATAQEVSQLSTYVAIRQNDAKRLKRYGTSSCDGGDLVACWMMSSEFIWPELITILGQPKEVAALELAIPLDKELLAEDASPFKDDTFLDQRDIDELDDSLIKLVKSP